MATQETFWVAEDGTQFATQSQALAYELRKQVLAVADQLESIVVQPDGSIDADAINTLVGTFQTTVAASAATLNTAIQANA